AELAALLVGARLDLEIGDDDGAADRLAEARDLAPTGASLAALERLEAELRYRRWDLKGAATILEERALPALAGSDDPQAEAAVQATLAELERHQGAFERAAKRVREQVLPRLKDDDDRAQRARALDLLAEIEVMRGPPGPALAIRRDQELPLYAALGDRWGEARAQRRIADYELARGKNGAAEAAYEAAKAAAEASGDPREALRLERWYGEFIYVRSDFRGALEREAAVVRGYARLGDPQGYAMHLASRAEIAAMLGDLGESMRVVKREALPLAEAIGDDFARLSVRATQAALYDDRGMPREALKIRRDELLPHYKRMANPRDEAFTHVFIADSLMDLGDLDEAERRITRGQRTLKALGEVRLGALCLDRLSRVHEIRGDFPGAARLNVEERAVYERIGDALGVATVDHQRSNQLMRQGDYDAAMRLLERTVMPELRRLGAIAYWASAATDLGAAYSERGDFDRALTIFSDQALPAYESIGDRRSAADVQAQIGDIHYARGDCDTAVEIYREAVLPAYTSAGDVRGRASTLSRIAGCHVYTGKSTEALALYRQALEIYESLGDAYSAAVMYGEIGTVYEMLGKYGPALDLYRERVLPVYERSGDRIAVAVAKSRMADLHFALGDMDRAITIREAENEVFRAAGSDYYLMGSRWMLAIYLDRRNKAGDRDRARELADQALAVAIRLSVPEEAMIRAFIQSMRP
ncbi:MAG: tetratricopeptide repeat protein, partial [Myxococcales bacterium]|nr:tetratricopeptide repeat protein [Myxococcales bacterium]